SGSPSPSPTPTPSATVRPSPSPSPSTSPTAAPPQPLPTSSAPPRTAPGPDRSLRTNAIFRIDLDQAAASCDLKVRRPKPPLANKKLQPYLTEVVGCLTTVFKAPLAARGFTLVEPKVKTYHRGVESPCGDFGQHGSPAYYCSRTSTVYWPDTVDDGREAYTFARLGYVGLAAHEFGHHLQATTGMLGAYSDAYEGASKKERYALSRRLELQAQCFEGVFLHAERSDLDVTAKDSAELKAWHSYTGDEDPPKSRKPDHGSSRAQYAWLARGLASGDFADCNTWTASSKSVT
ncbi:MAG: neutral zinc metallopeptidase, partial [Janthinobacterium lividum]